MLEMLKGQENLLRNNSMSIWSQMCKLTNEMKCVNRKSKLASVKGVKEMCKWLRNQMPGIGWNLFKIWAL